MLLVPFAAPNLLDILSLTGANLLGLAYMSLVGGALTYILWFRGIARIEPAKVSLLGVLNPLTAVILGWVLLAQSLTQMQFIGAALALFSLWLGQTDLSLKSIWPRSSA